MPNTSNDDVIIVGSLSDKELRDSIDKLVDYVGDKTTIMAGKFDVAMEKMKSAMKDFAITQKVNVDLMQDAWKQMSASFDAMLKAQQNATSSGNNNGAGGGNSQYADNTVGHLQEIIALEEKRRKEMQLGSDALRDQNKLIEEQKAKLKGETTSDQVKAAQSAKKELQEAFTMPARGLADAEKKLQQLQSLSAKFQGKGILDQTQWNRLNAQIQTTQEKIDKLRQKKPTSIQDVLGMDESSVDAIAKKMVALKKVTVDPQNTAQVKQLGDEYQRLKRLQAELMGQNIQMTHSNNYLAQSFGYIRNRLVYAMTLGAITSFTKQVYEIRGQYELLERSLGVLVNSFERGSQIFQELNQMAIESPFTLMELAGAAKQLTAYNFAANEVVDTTRRLADISAALGVPMERLTYNLGQIRAQTVLTARDARDFANAGLPIVASLAEHFTELEGKIVTTGDVYDRMSKKMVSYSDVMAVLNKMTDEGGKFFEFQAKQAETLRVQMANLNLAWNNMLNDIGKTNQGLLTLPVSGLKALFQNWQSIDRVLKSMLVTFGLWKALQVVAIRQQWAWAAATGATAKQMGVLGNAAKSFFGGLKALATNPWTWVFVGIQAIVDLAHQFWNARQEMHELNQEISDNANEASESMLNYLNNKGNISTRQLAQQNKLTAEQGEKAWESVSEQIKQSALSANSLIAELLTIPDINERVATSFDYAERIQKAQAALQDLKEDSIKVNQDYTFLGIGEEGLVTDLQDYANEIIKFEGTYKELQDLLFTSKGTNTPIKIHFHEFDKELDDTAESINNFIRAYNITDPLQINEILERVRSQIKAKNPEIKGEAAKIFDISLDQKMSELTNGAVDRNASLWNMFMERLVHRSHNAFQDINDDWIKSNEKLSPEQQAAVDANLQYFKDSMPYAYQAVSEMVADASKLKIHIGIAFNVQQLSDFQKEVKKRIKERIKEGSKDLDFGNIEPTEKDDLISYTKTLQEEIKKRTDANKQYARDNTKWAKKRIATNNEEIKQLQNRLDLFHQAYKEEKSNNNNKRKDSDVIAEALKEELKIIKEMRGNYEKLRKAGVSNIEAIELASQGYGATIIRINNVLQKYGIDKFNASNFAGKDVRSLLQALEKTQSDLLKSGKVKTSSLLELTGVIKDLRIEVKTDDMKKVTDGLNNELTKIKDEYELAVELDANPELGNVFTDMFGIDTTNFPKTIDEFMKRTQAQFNDASKKLKYDVPLDIFKANDEQWIKWGEDVGIVTEQIDEFGNKVKDTSVLDKFKSSFTPMIGVAKKWVQDTVKGIQDLQYKLGDYNKKLEIERAKLKVLEDQAANETNANMKRLLELRVKEQKETIEKLEMESVKLLPFYEDLFGDMYNVSVRKLKQIVKAAKEVMTPRTGDEGIGYTQRKDDKGKVVYDIFAKDEQGNIKKTTVSLEEYIKINKQIDSIQGKIAESSPWEKIKDSFSKKEGGKGIKNFASGMEAIGGELQKVANITKEIGGFAEALGADEETVETINDVATSIGGVATAAQGIGQIAKGDYIGGVTSFLSGAVSAISTWFDNSNKRIDRQIEQSERRVKSLQSAYEDLSHAMNEAYGYATIGAQKAAIANKELQLAELERQLQLEKSRKKKNQDQDKILDLQEQIRNLKYEISDAVKEITNDLLNISSVGDAAEELAKSMLQAFKNGEDYMKVYEDSFDDMIDNMIAKAIAGQIIGRRIQMMFDQVQRIAAARANEQQYTFNHGKQTGTYDEAVKNLEKKIADAQNENARKYWESELKAIREQYNEAAQPTPEDIRSLRDATKEGYMSGVEEESKAWLEAAGVVFGQDSEKSLSNLQQGIQSITEDTAGAIEAYLNGVSQQVYLHSELLTQIRDTLQGFDFDVQLGVVSQILLQLQSSYQVQMSIQNTLQGVLNPSGRAIVVELNS